VCTGVIRDYQSLGDIALRYRDQTELHTELLKESRDPLYVRYRELLSARGIDPSTAVLAESFPDDVRLEFGIVVTADRRVYLFSLEYRDKPVEEGTFMEWEDLTNTWQSSNYSNAIARAVRLLAQADEPENSHRKSAKGRRR
jgi:hypothetical protein